MSKQLRSLTAKLKKFALSFPEAWEDHPWGESAIKVKKKIFVFFGMPGDDLRLSVKLPQSHAQVLADFDFAEPTGYGLGKSGWVTATIGAGQRIPAELVMEWIDESYRAVAPGKLVAEIDKRA